MNKEYFNETEKTDYELLEEFNNNTLHLSQLGQTPTKHHTDASGYTATSRYFNLELKQRNQEIRINENGEFYIKGYKDDGTEYNCDGVYIEQHKVCSMLLDWICYGYEPIYINFLKNGIVVYNLSKLKKRPEPQRRKIQSRGYGKMEIGTRENLYLTDATIYDNNFRLIKKPSE